MLAIVGRSQRTKAIVVRGAKRGPFSNHMQSSPLPDLELQIEELLKLHEGLTREQLIKHLQREETSDTASRAPFPGPLREAFASGPRIVLGHTLQPVNLGLISALERIDSPLIDMVEIIAAMKGRSSSEIAKAIKKKLDPKIDILLATFWCFVTPLDDVELELEKGSASLMRRARKEIGRKHTPQELPKLNEAVLEHYVVSFSTAQQHRAKDIERSGSSFPSAPAEMDSAGALTSAAS